MLATPLMRIPGPLPACDPGALDCVRVAYCTRSSFSTREPIVDTSCPAVECWRSLKSVPCCTEFGTPDVVLPMLLGMKLSKKM
jgi:hypothetical protein